MRFQPRYQNPPSCRLVRPDSATTVERTFVCSDVVSFSGMIGRLGDRAALRLMRRIAQRIRGQVSAHAGTELELRGDCFLLAFPSPLLGLEGAVAIQRAVEADAARSAGGGVELRTAIHTGTVLRDGDHYFGRDLILPFRLLEQTDPGEVVASLQLQQRVDDGWRRRFGPERSCLAKGFDEPLPFAGVAWREEPSEEPADDVPWSSSPRVSVGGTG